jgi:hypothetical protein
MLHVLFANLLRPVVGVQVVVAIRQAQTSLVDLARLLRRILLVLRYPKPKKNP